MLRGLYTSYTGMAAQQVKMDVIANNLANADTVGFKHKSVTFKSFKDVLATKVNDPSSIGNKVIGNLSGGTSVNDIYSNYGQGGLNYTAEPFAFALEGDGMFVVGQPNEDGTMTELYTRDGDFTLDQDGNLVTKDGLFVMGENGVINISEGEFAANYDGSIYINNKRINKIKATSFDDMQNLENVGDNAYQLNAYKLKDIGQKTEFEGNIRQGYLESSNVDSVKEMISMINMQRSYESSQRLIKAYDSTLDKAVNSVGRI